MAKTKKSYTFGTGRRKTAVARVRIAEGKGQILINGRPLRDYFTEEKDRAAIYGPLEITDLQNRLDIWVNVRGGGPSGQAGATSQGIARAIKAMFEPDTPPAPKPVTTPVLATTEGTPAPEASAPSETSLGKKLRDSGFLTRDSRMKERKKYGRKGARKSFQFSKR